MRKRIYKIFGIPLFSKEDGCLYTTHKLFCIIPLLSFYSGHYGSKYKLFGLLPLYHRDVTHYDRR
jgi:hypothetical protein